MAENSKIEWTDHTFNPWWGCVEVSPACDNCYARELDKRFGGNHWGSKAPRRRTSEKNWNQMLKWQREAERLGIRYKVFCASMGDMGDKAIPQSWRDDFVVHTDKCPNLDILLLTKRPQLLVDLYPAEALAKWWIGTTVENQEEAERRIPHVLMTPAKYRFLSCEPLLGPVDLTDIPHPSPPEDKGRRGSALWGHEVANSVGECAAGIPPIDWVIAGGESGHKARPMNPDWARSLRDQCKAAGTAFFFKQWGEWVPGSALEFEERERLVDEKGFDDFHVFDGDNDPLNMMIKLGKKHAGRLLDGVAYSEFPDQLAERAVA